MPASTSAGGMPSTGKRPPRPPPRSAMSRPGRCCRLCRRLPRLTPRCRACLRTVGSRLGHIILTGTMYLLGPLLIGVACTLIFVLTGTFFTVLLPMLAPGGPMTVPWVFHVSVVLFLLVNVLFNYAMCVCTRNGGEKYERVVRELARATGYNYPEGPEEVEASRRDYEQLLSERRRQGQVKHLQEQSGERRPPCSATEPGGTGCGVGGANVGGGGGASSCDAVIGDGDGGPSSGTVPNGQSATNVQRRHFVAPHDANATVDLLEAGSGGGVAGGIGAGGGGGTARHQQQRGRPRTAAPAGGSVHAWTLLGPHEWGFCNRTRQPKPPRSHYDHISRKLVLNMDHFCPWMFNTVGYFNYRYFCNFLFYVCAGMFYGLCIVYRPLKNLDSDLYRQQIRLSREKGLHGEVEHVFPFVPTPNEHMSIFFSFLLCLSLGIAVFCLMSFHVYLVFTAQTTIEFHANWPKRRRARHLGRPWVNPYDLGPRRNWEQVYGSSRVARALMPSSREPEFLPVPLAGEKGRRCPHVKKAVNRKRDDLKRENSSKRGEVILV